MLVDTYSNNGDFNFCRDELPFAQVLFGGEFYLTHRPIASRAVLVRATLFHPRKKKGRISTTHLGLRTSLTPGADLDSGPLSRFPIPLRATSGPSPPVPVLCEHERKAPQQNLSPSRTNRLVKVQHVYRPSPLEMDGNDTAHPEEGASKRIRDVLHGKLKRRFWEMAFWRDRGVLFLSDRTISSSTPEPISVELEVQKSEGHYLRAYYGSECNRNPKFLMFGRCIPSRIKEYRQQIDRESWRNGRYSNTNNASTREDGADSKQRLRFNPAELMM
eukprot:220391-Amorphochlora_amoeboformis.AAC.1